MEDVRSSLARYILRERNYEFDVKPIYKKVKNSIMIEPLNAAGQQITPEISLFLEKIKKTVINCDIILKSKVRKWRTTVNFNIIFLIQCI
jgi:hypothetical protein